MASDLHLFSPETALLVGALLVFILSVLDASYRAAWAVGLLAALLSTVLALTTAPHSGEPFFPGIYRVDLFSQLLKIGLAGGLFLVLLLMRELPSVRPGARVDTPLFLLVSTTGMMMLVSATELLTLYLSLELSAYGLYIVVALHRNPRPASEAAVKYVLFGAAASAITLYGLSLVFGATGTTYLAQIAEFYLAGPSTVLIVGLLLVLAGFFFKLAVFPFHFWAPDVYQAAPNQLVAFVASISKLGAVGIIARTCSLIGPSPEGMFQLLWLVAVLSMTVGNLAAIAQRDFKRLLAYSAIAHGGYLMVGYVALSEVGLAATIFYGIVYVATVALAFVVVCAVGADGDGPSVEGLAGLYQRSPLLALMLLVAMFGLGGIPPTAGFFGKWVLFAAALERQQFWLVLIAAINSTIALYYYLLVIRAAYLLPPEDRPPVEVGLSYRIAGYLAMAVVLAAGIYPTPLWMVARRAAGVLLGA
jgi:NADH-quinone oxidoreductase subunit N